MAKGHIIRYPYTDERARLLSDAAALYGTSGYTETIDAALRGRLREHVQATLFPAPPPVSDAAQLKAAREAAGLSRDELAEVMGVATVTVARWERGGRPLTEAARVWLAGRGDS